MHSNLEGGNNMQEFLLDCSVTMAWCFADEGNEYTESVLDSLVSAKAFVPNLWSLEVCNVLLMAQRRNRINDSGIFQFITSLSQLPISTVEYTIDIRDLTILSQKYQLSAYDCHYLNLALEKGLTIATLDKQLSQAAIDSGCGVYLL